MPQFVAVGRLQFGDIRKKHALIDLFLQMIAGGLDGTAVANEHGVGRFSASADRKLARAGFLAR
jgi:hypothetical protein